MIDEQESRLTAFVHAHLWAPDVGLMHLEDLKYVVQRWSCDPFGYIVSGAPRVTALFRELYTNTELVGLLNGLATAQEVNDASLSLLGQKLGGGAFRLVRSLFLNDPRATIFYAGGDKFVLCVNVPESSINPTEMIDALVITG